MAVSKHNQWKRQKNGLMKLVRSNRDWLQKRRETRARTKSGVRDSMGAAIESATTAIHNHKTDSMVGTKVGGSSTKRTQVGKKI